MSSYYFRQAMPELLAKKLVFATGKGRATEYVWNISMVEQLDMINKLQRLVLKS